MGIFDGKLLEKVIRINEIIGDCLFLDDLLIYYSRIIYLSGLNMLIKRNERNN